MILKPPKGILVNRGHNMARGLVGCWLMNEGTGTLVNDLSGNGNTGIRTGAGSVWVPGIHGPAPYLPGSGDYINCGNNAVLNQGDNITFVSWLKMPVEGGFNKWMGKQGGGDGFECQTFDSAATIMWIVNTSGGQAVKNVDNVADGTWHHVVLTLKAGVIRCYVDGIIALDDTYTPGGGFANTDDFVLGARSSGSGGRECSFDNTSFYNRALTAGEIAKLYREPFCMFEVDL